MTVFEFLRAEAANSLVWGQSDCAIFASEWWRVSRGVDPAAPLRGTYGSAAECAAVLREGGGLVAVCDALCLAVGARRTDAPRLGDLGVIALPNGIEMAAISTGVLWGVRTRRGTAEVRASRRAAWRL